MAQDATGTFGGGDEETRAGNPPPRATRAPERIGRYRILGLLGRGGMGVVYEAEQDQPRRLVALKVIQGAVASPSLLRRFEQEALLLGKLQHPGIAQIYDAGTADVGHGEMQPFFAMELVRGKTLRAHVQDAQLGTRERLELFVRICDAVHHAHQRGIIHRDLKPANVLVDESGQPKILDFGVARVTDADAQATRATSAGEIVGTLAYMSPEQVSGDTPDLDARSDVYSLGVVLYELLASRLPYELRGAPLPEMLRVIRDEDPPLLSAVNRTFRGDLETIVAKALEKPRERRYASAAELGADVQRFLRHEPIVARPSSMSYRVGKFARRNKAIVAGVAAVFVALAAGTVVATLQAVRARREAAKAVAVKSFLQEMLASNQPSEALGRDLTVREVLEQAAKKIDGSPLAAQPEVEADVRKTIGNTYGSLGAYAESHAQLSRALELERAAGVKGGPLAATLADLAGATYRLQDVVQAEALHREALETFRRSAGDGDPRLANYLTGLAFFLGTQGRDAEAVVLYREALALLRRPGADPLVLSAVLLKLGGSLATTGSFEEAEKLAREALAIRRKVLGTDEHPEIAGALWYLGMTLLKRGDLDGAAPAFEQALAIRRRILGDGHPDTALVLDSLGELRSRRGDLEGSRSALEEALAIREKSFGPDATAVASSLSSLGRLYSAQGDLAGAERYLRRALAIFEQRLGPQHPDLSDVLGHLGPVMQRSGDLVEAERIFRRALQVGRAAPEPRNRRTAKALLDLAGLLFPKGDAAGAEAACLEALSIMREVVPSGSPALYYSLRQTSFVLQARGAWAEAEPLEREAYEIEKKNRPAGSPARNLSALSLILLHLERWADAEPLLRECVAQHETSLPPGRWETINARSMLGEALAGQGKDAEAESLLVESDRLLAEHSDAPPNRKREAHERVARWHRTP